MEGKGRAKGKAGLGEGLCEGGTTTPKTRAPEAIPRDGKWQEGKGGVEESHTEFIL